MTEIPEFLFPRKLVRTRGAIAAMGGELRQSAIPRGSVMIIADRVVHEHGLLAGLLDGLTAEGYHPELFAEIAGEPELEMVQRAVDAARELSSVAFIGVGGGSALDTAKLVAYSSASQTPLAELVGPVPMLPESPYLALIPTTVGTGSEATRVAMLTVDGSKRIVTCPQFVPAVAVLDGDLVAGLPAPVVAATALDALAHAVESMLSTTRNELTWTFASQAARTILSRLRAAMDGSAPEARAELLYASFLAGMALNAGVVLGHSLSYVLASRLHLAHGVGCAVALPYCLAYNGSMQPDGGQAIAAEVLGAPGATLRDLSDAAFALAADVGMPQELASLGVSAAESTDLAEHLITQYPRPTNPLPLTSERVSRLIDCMRTGDLAGAWTAFEEAS